LACHDGGNTSSVTGNPPLLLRAAKVVRKPPEHGGLAAVKSDRNGVSRCHHAYRSDKIGGSTYFPKGQVIMGFHHHMDVARADIA